MLLLGDARRACNGGAHISPLTAMTCSLSLGDDGFPPASFIFPFPALPTRCAIRSLVPLRRI
jgi:hypothetical protein